MIISSALSDDIPKLLIVQAILMTTPAIASLFFFDLCDLCVSSSKQKHANSREQTEQQSGLTDTLGVTNEHTNIQIQENLPHKDSRENQSVLDIVPVSVRYTNENGDHALEPSLGTGIGIIHNPTSPSIAEPDTNCQVRQETFCEALWFICINFVFIRTCVAISFFVGVLTAWLSLSDQVAPPSLNTKSAIQLFIGLLFGFGMVSLSLTQLINLNASSYISTGRIICLTSIPFVLMLVFGWTLNILWMIYLGASLIGLTGFGLLPICVEYGIFIIEDARKIMNERTPAGCPGDYNVKNTRNTRATVIATMMVCNNIFGVAIIYLTSPGTIAYLTKKNIPYFWCFLMILGIVIFFTLPERNEDSIILHQDNSEFSESCITLHNQEQ